MAEALCDSDRELVADVFSAFSQHPSIARSAKVDLLRTQAAQATARRVAAMIREGVPVGALASATTHHLDEMTRQTRAVVWSSTYCEPAYDRVHSDWTMRRAQRTRVREEQAARAAEWREESVDDAVVDEGMAKYRRAKPTSTPTPAALDDATTADDVRRSSTLSSSRRVPATPPEQFRLGQPPLGPPCVDLLDPEADLTPAWFSKIEGWAPDECGV